jgi:5-methylcytosine-specific restriction endonuclease McrA
MPRPLARPLPRGAALALCPAAAPLRPRDAEHRPDRRHARRALPRADRATGFTEPRDRRRAFSLCAKRAMKAATLRDCGRRCVYCAEGLAYDTLTLDHVYPRAKGGPDVAGNVVAACGRCNRMKADMLPTEFFYRNPWAGLNFVRYARAVHRALKRGARRAVSLACAAEGGLEAAA